MLAALLPLLDKLPKHRVLCVGDVMLDRYVYGQVDRISPEAPIPVLATVKETVMLGGNGNVVRNIVALGGGVDIISVIGADSAGYQLTEEVAKLSQVTSYIYTDHDRPTTVKTRFVAGTQQLLRADKETKEPLSAEAERQLIQRVSVALEGCSVVVLSDYAKGVLTASVIAEIVQMARKAGKPVIIDPKGHDYARYKGASYLTPNRKELSEAVGYPIRSVEDAEKAARSLIDAYGLDGLLSKLGSDGVCMVEKDKPAQHYRTHAREVFDVSGAGDTVIATMALALAGGLSVQDSAAIANLAGSVVVGKIGTAVVSRDEIAREITRGQTAENVDKILSVEEAVDLASRYKLQGLRIGFTNGCFDLLHPGHISSIRQARAACDKLFIGLNSDASVRRTKGDGRPVQAENARAIVLASLTDVDGVVIFDADTPIELIKALKPDILIKGANYTVDQVIGWEEVQSWGGKVVLVDVVDGQSTSETLKRLQTKNA